VDSEDKAAASEIAEYFGFDLSSVTRAFYKQMIREHRIPLDLTMQEPNAQSLAAIKETEEMIQTGSGQAFTSGKALIEAALAL
jgi:DNA-damage-inducible protein J